MATYSYEELIAWNAQVGAYPMASRGNLNHIDYHRAQLERWLWDNRDRFAAPVVEVGAEFVHTYIPGLVRLNTQYYQGDFPQEGPPTLYGDVRALPFSTNSIGTLIVTEVLEHVFNIFRAVSELERVLKPGGWLFASTPFCWPTHDTDQYHDFWRIAPDGWRTMLSNFESVVITPVELRRLSKLHLTAVVDHEAMGNTYANTLPPGYCIAARK